MWEEIGGCVFQEKKRGGEAYLMSPRLWPLGSVVCVCVCEDVLVFSFNVNN